MPPSDITVWLAQWSQGDQEAFDRASEVVYPELRRIADAYLKRERTDHTLQPTALIHEAFLRLSGQHDGLEFASRKHFYALAARLMRQILVDHARAVNSQKRGGGVKHLPMEYALQAPADCAEQVLEIHDALDELRALNPRKAKVVELRYFGGLTLDEAAEVLEISRASAHREERMAMAWLTSRISR
ncbi:MAG: sigma-70 family RNA polymerase sigma factor [Bryobacterales bacterium]|nr:sigma-70 family RNA polymerase sigma factor [Bryobacterales bacterium]